MDPDKVRKPMQVEGAPSWEDLLPELIAFCERSRSAVTDELRKYPNGSKHWEILSGLIQYCGDVVPLLKDSSDWAAAWVANAEQNFHPRFKSQSERNRSRGRSLMTTHLAIRIQTGDVPDLELSRDLYLDVFA